MEKVKLYNLLNRKKEEFRPIRKEWVGLYTCGPTVYNYAHIGNLRTYIFEDILRRTLEYTGFKVRHVMNITDVGHLISDADEGEDKLEKGAKREGKSVWEITKFYTESFLKDVDKLNIKRANHLLPATHYIKEQIKIIKVLFKKGYAYETSQAIYFDVSKFKNYTKLSRQKLNQKITGARKEVVVDPQKRNPYDFALWFKLVGRFENHTMRWPSPWGTGFPGWHIECSAISVAKLGQPFDIHTGGVDHINVHHTNEIAQSEAAFGKPLARYWMHGEFLLIDAGKMAKSEGNFITLDTLLRKEFNPLAFRYLVLTSHYRSKLNFTWNSLGAAQNSLEKLYKFIQHLVQIYRSPTSIDLGQEKQKFAMAIFEDLNTPKALTVVWDLVHQYNKSPEKYDPKDVLKTLYDFDAVLGLGLKAVKPKKLPPKILKLVQKREEYRNRQDWKRADKIRTEILRAGYTIKDTPTGPQVTK